VTKCLKCGAELPPQGECPQCAKGARPQPLPGLLQKDLQLDRRGPAPRPAAPPANAPPPGLAARSPTAPPPRTAVPPPAGASSPPLPQRAAPAPAARPPVAQASL